MKNWFEDCKTIEEVKKKYKALAFEYHPDVTKKDTTIIMAEINNQYDLTAIKFKNIHRNFKGEIYEKESEDTSQQFKDIINKVIHFENVLIEICGAWLWISGDTIKYKETLKELKFNWSSNKTAWYYHNQPKKRSKGDKTLDEIREMYGSKQVARKQLQKKIS